MQNESERNPEAALCLPHNDENQAPEIWNFSQIVTSLSPDLLLPTAAAAAAAAAAALLLNVSSNMLHHVMKHY